MRLLFRGTVVAFLFGVGLIAFYSYSPSLTTSYTPASMGGGAKHTSPTIPALIFTSPEKVVEQFYSDVLSGKYSDVYALLSARARQYIEPAGGASFLAQQMQAATNIYGAVTNYAVMNRVTHSPTEIAITFVLHRQKFLATQTEKDIFTITVDRKSWLIDHWTSDITNRRQ